MPVVMTPLNVRSSIIHQLNQEKTHEAPSSRQVDGMVEMTLNALQNYEAEVTAQRLFCWHSALFPTGVSGLKRIAVGRYREGPMQVLSGSMGREKIHYEAPEASRVEPEMDLFLRWCNAEQGLDPVLKAGIAHFWFVSIHPFEDGNGRIARALADLYLARADGSERRLYSMSRQIEEEKSDYYRILETQQRDSSDLTRWMEWFLHCLGRSLSHAEKALSSTLFASSLWEMLSVKGVNERQRLIVSRMLDEDFRGFMNTSKYAKIAKCSTDTALRDITDLKEKGVLIRNDAGGRSTSYRIVTAADAFVQE